MPACETVEVSAGSTVFMDATLEHLAQVPLVFCDDRIERFYIGGSLLNEWRRMPPVGDSHWCEELLVSSIGAISSGKPSGYAISRTVPEQGSISLAEIIAAHPNEVLGTVFQNYNPGNLSVLARAGDTTVRLVLQCHVKRADARRCFDMPMGKTEAWYIADTRSDCPDPCVYVGFREGVTKEQWRKLFDEQDVDGMVACLHRIPVSRGDMVLVPAGMPHCVGPGCLFLEYHECNDVTIRLEKHANGLDLSEADMFCGLSADEGMELFDYSTFDKESIYERCVMRPRVLETGVGFERVSLIDHDHQEGFELELIQLNGSYTLPQFDGHRVLVAVEGDVTLRAQTGDILTLAQGHGACVPAACKGLVMEGSGAKVTVGIPVVNE